MSDLNLKHGENYEKKSKTETPENAEQLSESAVERLLIGWLGKKRKDQKWGDLIT